MGRAEQEKSNYGSLIDQITTGAGILHPTDDLSKNTMHRPTKGWGSRAFMHGLLGPCDGGYSWRASAPALPASPLLSCSCTSCFGASCSCTSCSCSCTSCFWASCSALPAPALSACSCASFLRPHIWLHLLLDWMAFSNFEENSRWQTEPQRGHLRWVWVWVACLNWAAFRQVRRMWSKTLEVSGIEWKQWKWVRNTDASFFTQ